MNKPLIVLSLLFISITARSQFIVEGGPHLMIPISTSKATNVGIGGTFSFGYEFKNIGIRGNVAYNPYRGKVYTDEFLSITTIRGGIQAFVVPQKLFFVGDAGVAFYKSKATGTDTSGFTYGIGLGYRHVLKKGLYLQPSLNYNNYKFDDQRTYTWWNMAFSIGFKL